MTPTWRKCHFTAESTQNVHLMVICHQNVTKCHKMCFYTGSYNVESKIVLPPHWDWSKKVQKKAPKMSKNVKRTVLFTYRIARACKFLHFFTLFYTFLQLFTLFLTRFGRFPMLAILHTWVFGPKGAPIEQKPKITEK